MIRAASPTNQARGAAIGGAGEGRGADELRGGGGPRDQRRRCQQVQFKGGDGWLLAAAAYLHRARDARADGARGRGGLDGLASAHRAAHGRRAGDGGRGDANHLSS